MGSGRKIPRICTVNWHIFPHKDIPYSVLQIPFLIEGFSVVPSWEIHFGILIQRLFYFTGILNYEFDCTSISFSLLAEENDNHSHPSCNARILDLTE